MHGRAWSDPPRFNEYFVNDFTRLGHMFKVLADTKDVNKVLALVPKDCMFLRNILPSLQRCRGQFVRLVLGLCPRRSEGSEFSNIQYPENGLDSRCFTQMPVWALESADKDGLTLHLSLRKV